MPPGPSAFPPPATGLRQHNESGPAQPGIDVESLSESDIRRLAHELQVHQIELELQNEELRSIQADLSHACDRYNALYDSAPVGYLTFDEATHILEANLEAARMLGVERGSLVGTQFNRFLTRDSREMLRRHRQLGSDSAGKQSCELIVCRMDGSHFPAQVESIRTLDNTESLPRWQLVLIDIAERKQAEQALRQSEESFQILAELVPTLLCSCDEQGRRDYVSPRFCEFTGLPPARALGCGWMDAVHPDDLTQMRRTWADAHHQGEPWEARFRLRSADGCYRWFMGRCHPLRDATGRVFKWLGCDTDIDALVRTQDALREADRRKDEFLATLAHELRNPLAPLANSIEILRTVGGDARACAGIHEIMERQVRHMTRLVDDLVEVSRISHGLITLVKAPVLLSAVIGQAIETSEPLIHERGHQLTVSLPPQPVVLEADPVRLGQVFANLLNNAAKFTEPGGSIQLSAHRAGNDVNVSIRDSGIGLSAQDLDRVFDLFTQVHGERNGHHSGLGIGLALARSLVELHGGQITAHSAGPGLGSKFVVLLPATDASGLAPQASGASKGTLARHRILLVDDNHDAADSLAALLTRRGASVLVAYGGAEAIKAVEIFQPTVVLMDLSMPGMSGFELARQIRQHPGLGKVHLIALSGWGQEADRCRSREAGMEHHLVKPIDIETLQDLLTLL